MGQLYSLFARTPDIGDANRAIIDRILDVPAPAVTPEDNAPVRAGISALLTRDASIPEDKFIALACDYARRGAERPGYPLHNVQVTAARTASEGQTDVTNCITLAIVGERK